MSLRNDSLTYGSMAKSLHWLLAVLIIGLLIVGFIIESMDPTPDKFKLIGIHKALGIIALFLVIVRIGWRFHNSPPMPLASLTVWEKRLAKAGHLTLYMLMIAMPLSGWAMSSAAGYKVSVFGMVTLPALVDPNPVLKTLFRDAHGIIAWALVAMISLHVMAALMHHFYHKNTILLRMLPWSKAISK